MILKLLQGGNALPPLVSYQPVTVTGGATAGASVAAPSNKQETADLTDLDLLKMLEKLDGLPSDMAVLTLTLLNFYIDLQYSPFPSTSNIASRYLQALNQMKVANFNRKEYDDAFSTVDKNGGINEVAITDRGLLFCMNKEGDYKLFSLELLKENPDYQPLTNSELLYYRAQSPQLANNNELLKVVKNGIGIESVTKMILDNIGNLGTTSKSNEGFVKTQASLLINGLQEFIIALQQSGNYNATVDNLYKGKFLTKNLAILALAALNYIYTTLPANAKTLLKTKTLNGTDAEAVELILKLISSTLSTEQQFSLDLDTPNTSDTNKKDDSADNNKGFKLDPVSLLFSGRGQKEKAIILTPAGKDMGLEVPAIKMSITKDKKAIGSQATLNDVSTSDFGGTFDWNNVTMGDATIKTNALDLILIDGNSLKAAYLPVDMEAYVYDGTIRPDINMLGRYKEVLKDIKDRNITDPKEINKIYADHNLPIIYTPNGDVTTNYIKFGIINGEAMSTAFSKDVSLAEWLTEVIDENEINNTLNILNKGRKEGTLLEYDQNDKWSIFEGSYNNLYKGTIFIPMNTDYFTATSTAGNPVTPAQADLIEATQQAVERSKSYINPGNTL